jgi:hypothetical protein
MTPVFFCTVLAKFRPVSFDAHLTPGWLWLPSVFSRPVVCKCRMSLTDNHRRSCGKIFRLQREANTTERINMPTMIWDQDAWDNPVLFWSDNPMSPAPLNRRKNMDEFALKLQESTLDEKVTLSIDIEEGLTSTSHVPTGAALAAALAAKRALITTKNGDIATAESQLLVEQNALLALEGELDTLLVNTCKDAQKAVADDRAKMEEMNIPLRKIGTPATQPPDAPANVRGSYGDMNGEVDFQWDGQGRGVIYFGEIAEDPAGPFVQCYVGSKSRCTVKNKVPGQMYYFRLAVERNGLRSNPSELANHRAR